MNITDHERDKYQRIWSVSAYREHSPGEQWMPLFLEMVGDERGTLLDAGCGTGRAGQALASKGFDVTLLDFAPGALEVDGLPMVEQPVWSLRPSAYRFGYCCDVLEHLPPEFTMLSVARLLEACERVFLTICTEPDVFGVRIGEPLHLTVQPFVWWRDRLRELGTVLEARDCLNTSVFLVES